MRRTIVSAMTTAVMAGVALAAGMSDPASAQSNLDAGKSAAQMFVQGCSTCHRSPQEVVGASSDFLLEHYTTGPRQAEAMAAYLATVRSEPARAAKPRRAPQTGAADVVEVVSTGSIRTAPAAAAGMTELLPEAPSPEPTPDLSWSSYIEE